MRRAKWTVRRPSWAVGACVAALVVATLPAWGAKPPRPGCAPRLATAYDGSGDPLAHQPALPPLPCLVYTGFSTIETHLVVTRDGTVVQEPAVITPGLAGTAFLAGAPGPRPQQPTSPAGIAVSRTQGAHWNFVEPAGSLWTGSDAALYSDPITGRVFEETLAPGQVPEGGDLALQEQTPGGYAYLLATPDDGQHWHHTSVPGFLYQENARFTSAPPAPHQATTAGGYPDATYWCGNRDVGFTEPLILERECYRSLDGGVSWEQRSILFTNPLPRHPECGANAEDISSGDGYYPEGAADGSLYLMVSCGGTVYLARSTDEAATFPIIYSGQPPKPLTLPVPAGSGGFGFPELRVGEIGAVHELYLVHSETSGSTTRLVLRTSHDGGRTWAGALILTPKGLPSIELWAVAVRGTEVAVSYLSKSRTVPGRYDGYVSATRDALAASPTVWTATINPPSAPMLTSAPQSAKDDFIDVAIAPDGSPWASFFSPCSAEPPAQAATDPACEQAQGVSLNGGNERTAIGSFLWRSGG